MVASIVAVILFGLMALVVLGFVVVVLLIVGGALRELVSLGHGRRPSNSYRRQLLASERGRHRRRRKRGTNAHGITIFIDTQPPDTSRRP